MTSTQTLLKIKDWCKIWYCTHRHEPGCAVMQSSGRTFISESRHTSYLNMLEDKEEGIPGCLLINSFYFFFLNLFPWEKLHLLVSEDSGSFLY